MAVGPISRVLLAALWLGLAGCSALQPADSDDRGIKWVQPEGYPVFYYIREDAKNIGTYAGLYVAPIIADPAIAGDNVRRQQAVAKIVAYFHDALVAALNRHGLKVLHQPAPGALSMRIAMTGVTFAVVESSGQVRKVSPDDSFDALEITFEGEFIDAETEQVIAMAIDRRAARLVGRNKDGEHLTADDFRHLLDAWSDQMGRRLKEIADRSRG